MRFALEIASFAQDVEETFSLIVRKIVLDLYVRIVMRTPVLTGRARGNWLVAIGTMPTETVEALRKSANRSNAMQVLAGYDGLSEMSIFIVNNLDYIEALEGGHSDQAPDGMVRITIDEFLEIARRSLR